MKFPWTWLVIAVLVVVAYKAGQMSRTEGFMNGAEIGFITVFAIFFIVVMIMFAYSDLPGLKFP